MNLSFFKKPKTKRARRGYDAAQNSNLLAGFRASTLSADSALRIDLKTLRNRSRELYRNNDYIKNAVRVIATNVIGTGIPFQAQVKMKRGGGLDKKTNEAIENLWWGWTKADSCHLAGKYTFQQIEQILMKSVPKNGEVFVRIHRRRVGVSKVPLALQLLEADMLDDNFNALADNGNEIRMGIERNADGRPVNYYFFPRNPGDLGQIYDRYPNVRHVIVPAKDIIHLFVPDDENQTHAAPWFASAMKRMHHLQGYEEASVVGHRARASIMGFIESPEAQLEGDAVSNGDQVYDFEPGLIRNLKPGEKISVPQLGANGGDTDSFMKHMLRGAAAGIGMSYETFSKDYQGATYSSARQALLEDRDCWRILQWWFIRSFSERVLSEFLDMAYLSNSLNMPSYATTPELYSCVKWQPRGWAWIDPLKEVEALRAAVRSGFKTVTDVVNENGGDIGEYVDSRETEMQLFKDAGIILDTDPGQVSDKGIVQPVPPPPDGTNTPVSASSASNE